MTTSTLRQEAALPLQTGTMYGSSAATNDAAPYLVQGPVDGQGPNADLVFTFSEAVRAGTGTVDVRNGGGQVLFSYAITDNAVRISGSTVTLHLEQRLAYATAYSVSFGKDTILDLAGQPLQYSATSSFLSGLSPVALNLTGTAGHDTLHGSDFGDTLSGGAGRDRIMGYGGNDLIHGGDETGMIDGDTLDGGDGDDTIYGDGGADRLMGGNGNDMLYGGDGNDSLDGGAGDDLLEGGNGNDTLTAGSGKDTLRGGDGDDTLYGGHAGILDGGAGNDSLNGADGIDYIGGSGDDTITVGVDSTMKLASRIDGGTGNDRIQLYFMYETNARLAVTGGAGSDTIVLIPSLGSIGQDARIDITDFTPGAGGDVIDLLAMLPYDVEGNPFGSGVARLVADGADTLLQLRSSSSMTTYKTLLYLANVQPAQLTSANFTGGIDPGGSGKGIVLTGTAQGDKLQGFLLDDRLIGLDGNDTLEGAAGNDTLDGGAGNDMLEGGAGNDSLSGGADDDTLSDSSGDNRLEGGDGDDVLQSTSSGANMLDGGAGDDTLYGGSGNDTLSGGDGNDTIHVASTFGGVPHQVEVQGGGGRDLIVFDNLSQATLTVGGGDGADTFRFGSYGFYNEPHAVTITDFDSTGGDTIDLFALLPVDLGSNPFGSAGYLKAEQAGADVKLYLDRDGAALSSLHYQLIATLKNVALSSMAPSAFAGGLNIDGSNRGMQLAGTDGADTLAGGLLDDTIHGGAGDDVIAGGRGADRLYGDDGNDMLTVSDGGDKVADGGNGDDHFRFDMYNYGPGQVTARGGAGRDMFEVVGASRETVITISDFESGNDGDRIDLEAFMPWKTTNPFGDGTLRIDQRGSDAVVQFFSVDSYSGKPGQYIDVLTLQSVDGTRLNASNFWHGFNPDGSAHGMTLQAGATGQSLAGGYLDDTLIGGNGNDNLYGDIGSDLMVGGAGLDTVVYTGRSSAYVVTHDDAGWHVASRSSASLEGKDTLRDVERIAFYDRHLALDTDGTAGQAYRIYRAAFDRAPDLDGLGFWIGMMDKGISLHDVAAGFVQSEEFATLYGSAPTNAQIVTRLYQNILHRAPEQEGYAFWLGVLDNKLADLPAVLAAISESAENQDSVAALIADGIAYAPYFG